jgi:hypothetical protein
MLSIPRPILVNVDLDVSRHFLCIDAPEFLTIIIKRKGYVINRHYIVNDSPRIVKVNLNSE